jgi:hypothetical protein
MTSLPNIDHARLSLGKRSAFEGVARWPWMASGMGTDDARSTTTNRPRHHAQRVVEKVGRSITNSETPHTCPSSQIAITQKSRCTSKPIARPTHLANAIPSPPSTWLTVSGRTSGKTTQTDTSSKLNPGKSQGRPKRTARARSPSSKNGLPVCVLPTKPLCRINRRYGRNRTEPPRSIFMPRAPAALVAGEVGSYSRAVSSNRFSTSSCRRTSRVTP